MNPSPYVRLHAAESLVAFGYAEAVLPIFELALEREGNLPGQRICVWRVLARAKRTATERTRHVDQICAVCLSPGSPDAASAAESLAKLKYRVDAAHRTQFEHAIERLPGSAIPHGRWLLAVSGNAHDLERLTDLLGDPDPIIRGIAAYALRHIRDTLPTATLERILAVAMAETDPSSRKYCISAAFITASENADFANLKQAILDYLSHGTNDEKYESATALGIRGAAGDLDILVPLLHDADADVQVAASTAVLQILARTGEFTLRNIPYAVA
ncbi:MAG TPA: hypothetical protein VGN12_07005 [Pirellulales bacterium]